MITNPADYQQLLYQLEDENFPIKYPSLPSPEDEALIKINLQTKKIENTNNYVTIEGDHAAETLYFEVNRYHGLVDLSNMMCIVSYINADNEKRIYPVPYYDLVTKKDKIIFPWVLNYSATKKTGLLKYMITFYHIEKNTNTKIPLSTGFSTNNEVYSNFTVRFYQLESTQIDIFCFILPASSRMETY